MKSLIREKNYAFIVSIVFVFYLWMAAQIPYTYDDWEWGLDIGLQHLLTADINSRYAGNLIEVLLTRSVLLKTLVMGVVFTALPYAIAHFIIIYMKSVDISSEPQPLKTILFIAANVMILLMPVSVWRQTYGWIAGFSNYVVSGLLLILYFLLIAWTADESNNLSPVRCIGRFLFGLVIQLFLENLSAYFFIATLSVVIWRVIKKKKVGIILLLLLIGNGIGLLIAFSSSVYQPLWTTGISVGEYRRLMFDPQASPFSTALVLLFRGYTLYLPIMLESSAHIQLLVLFRFIVESACLIIRTKKGKIIYILWDAIHVLFFAFFLYRYIHIHRLPGLYTGSYYHLHFFYLVLITGDLMIIRKTEPKRFPWLMAVWVSPILIIAPMAAVNTLGPRLFFTSNICYIVFAFLLSVPLWDILSKPFRTFLAIILIACFLVCCLHYINIYREIGSVNRVRLAIMEDAKSGCLEICRFPAFPNIKYIWSPNPMTEKSLDEFRSFYGIPEQIPILFE